jgi:hypothetical protein
VRNHIAKVWGSGAEPDDAALYAEARRKALEKSHYEDVIRIDSHTEKVNYCIFFKLTVMRIFIVLISPLICGIGIPSYGRKIQFSRSTE